MLKRVLRTFLKLSRFAVFSLLLSACSRSGLSIHTDYLTRESLASFYVCTPDPLLDCPPLGQRLILSWSLASSCLAGKDPHLLIKVRYKNREEREWRFQLRKRSGTAIYRLVGQEFWKTGGILTYKVNLVVDGCIVEEWRHQLWADLILFEMPEEEEIQFLE